MVDLKVIDVDKMTDVRSLSGQFYRKSEVDGVIEEKDKEIAKLKAEKNTKNEEIDTLYKKSLSRLKELVNKEHPDKEEDHIEADDILCDMLNALGYKDLTEAWEKIDKWYC